MSYTFWSPSDWGAQHPLGAFPFPQGAWNVVRNMDIYVTVLGRVGVMPFKETQWPRPLKTGWKLIILVGGSSEKDSWSEAVHGKDLEGREWKWEDKGLRAWCQLRESDWAKTWNQGSRTDSESRDMSRRVVGERQECDPPLGHIVEVLNARKRVCPSKSPLRNQRWRMGYPQESIRPTLRRP